MKEREREENKMHKSRQTEKERKNTDSKLKTTRIVIPVLN
jgi:hypothetical protein